MTTRVYKAPEVPVIKFNDVTLFLAGSIEQGAAIPWQEEATRQLLGHADVIFNPRRDNWDSTWEQSKDNPLFVEQVTWELGFLTSADAVLMYFDPATKSPISLLELGILSCRGRSDPRTVVVCPKGYWRKGNVDIVCGTASIPVFETLDGGIEYLKEQLKTL